MFYRICLAHLSGFARDRTSALCGTIDAFKHAGVKAVYGKQPMLFRVLGSAVSTWTLTITFRLPGAASIARSAESDSFRLIETARRA